MITAHEFPTFMYFMFFVFSFILLFIFATVRGMNED